MLEHGNPRITGANNETQKEGKQCRILSSLPSTFYHCPRTWRENHLEWNCLAIFSFCLHLQATILLCSDSLRPTVIFTGLSSFLCNRILVNHSMDYRLQEQKSFHSPHLIAWVPEGQPNFPMTEVPDQWNTHKPLTTSCAGYLKIQTNYTCNKVLKHKGNETPKMCAIQLRRRWWIRAPGGKSRGWGFSADLVDFCNWYWQAFIWVLHIQNSVSKACSLILQNCTAHKGCHCLYFALSRRGINRFKHWKKLH